MSDEPYYLDVFCDGPKRWRVSKVSFATGERLGNVGPWFPSERAAGNECNKRSGALFPSPLNDAEMRAMTGNRVYQQTKGKRKFLDTDSEA